jgi:hypothetical protein
MKVSHKSLYLKKESVLGACPFYGWGGFLSGLIHVRLDSNYYSDRFSSLCATGKSKSCFVKILEVQDKKN